MWNQWATIGNASLPPAVNPVATLQMNAQPPLPPSEALGGQAATVTSSHPAAAGIATSVMPINSANILPIPAANPYTQYTAEQFASMTTEQQYALQQHWQQWQVYQQEYARWYAQYGEQVSRFAVARAVYYNLLIIFSIKERWKQQLVPTFTNSSRLLRCYKYLLVLYNKLLT